MKTSVLVFAALLALPPCVFGQEPQPSPSPPPVPEVSSEPDSAAAAEEANPNEPKKEAKKDAAKAEKDGEKRAGEKDKAEEQKPEERIPIAVRLAVGANYGCVYRYWASYNDVCDGAVGFLGELSIRDERWYLDTRGTVLAEGFASNRSSGFALYAAPHLHVAKSGSIRWGLGLRYFAQHERQPRYEDEFFGIEIVDNRRFLLAAVDVGPGKYNHHHARLALLGGAAYVDQTTAYTVSRVRFTSTLGRLVEESDYAYGGELSFGLNPRGVASLSGHALYLVFPKTDIESRKRGVGLPSNQLVLRGSATLRPGGVPGLGIKVAGTALYESERRHGRGIAFMDKNIAVLLEMYF